ncbi:hypothetical protein ACIBJI_23530 [Nocardia sp. NPDC050408]|uniref:magnesium chelatase subunit ChlI family protein n=1 Tax=Nocardia sp. NPDC050408 TaxID=3364319 RepID=UPI0037B07898
MTPAKPAPRVRHRVTRARAAAAARWREHSHTTNARVPAPLLRQHFPLSRTEAAPLEAALRVGRITRRGADRPSTHDIVEALHLRGFGTP